MKFPLAINDSQAIPTKHQHRGNLKYVSEQSVRSSSWKIFAFSHLKTAISFNILVGTSDILAV